MNIKEFLNQEGAPILYRLYCRKSNAGRLTYGAQVIQAFDLNNADSGNRLNWLLSQTQGSLGATKVTHNLNLSKDRAYALANLIGVEFTPEMEQEALNGTTSVYAYRPDNMTDEPIMFNDLSFFDTAIGIELTESPVKNPYRPSDTPVYNPQKGENVTYTVPATGEVVEVYRHTAIAPVSMINHQRIAEYFEEGSRNFPIEVEAQLAKERAAKVTSSTENIVTS